MNLPNKIFFTGVPGSRWSGISQELEQLDGINTSDHSSDRDYTHGKYSGHRGAYFGRGMEFDSLLNSSYIDMAWKHSDGCKIVKSHEWSLKLDLVRELYPDEWIMLVYRPNEASFNWWMEAGGFDISYPDYGWYESPEKMREEIASQNDSILKFASKHDLTWNYFTEKWITSTFGQSIQVKNTWSDVLVTVLK